MIESTIVDFYRPGIVHYEAARRWQDERAVAVAQGDEREAFVLLQHPAVFTRGRRSRPENLLVSENELRARGADVIETDRGGDITFHGPGQIVGYPILDLRRRRLGPVEYVRGLQTALIEALAALDIRGERVQGRPGVWLDGAKIASIGVRVRRGVSSHGFAVNVCPDLRWFRAIVACGLRDASVTSIAEAPGDAPEIAFVEAEIAAAFARVFDVELAARWFDTGCFSLPPARLKAWPKTEPMAASAR
jgi:lipoyl(octanoyl) transferase